MLSTVCKLIKSGVSDRSSIADKAQLRPNSVCDAVSYLISKKILINIGTLKSGRGKPRTILGFNNEFYRVISINILENAIEILIGDICGNILSIEHFNDVNRNNISKTIEEFILSIGLERVAYICVSGTGMLDTEKKMIINSYKIPEYNGSYIDDIVCVNVNKLLIRSNHAMAFAELKNIDNSKLKNFMFIHIGSGVGCAVVSSGHFLSGFRGLAGELGHFSINDDGVLCTCGKRGCIEAVCSEIAIIKKINSILEKNDSSLNKLYNVSIDNIGTLESKEIVVSQLLDEAGAYAGNAIAKIASIIAPEVIILGGSVVWNSSVFTSSLKREAFKHFNSFLRDDIQFLISDLKKNSVLTGAYFYALDYMFDHLEFLEKK